MKVYTRTNQILKIEIAKSYCNSIIITFYLTDGSIYEQTHNSDEAKELYKDGEAINDFFKGILQTESYIVIKNCVKLPN